MAPGAPKDVYCLRVDLACKSASLEGAFGLAAIEGLEWIGPEHLLAACLQSQDPLVLRAVKELHVHADFVRGKLLEWIPEFDAPRSEQGQSPSGAD